MESEALILTTCTHLTASNKERDIIGCRLKEASNQVGLWNKGFFMLSKSQNEKD